MPKKPKPKPQARTLQDRGDELGASRGKGATGEEACGGLAEATEEDGEEVSDRPPMLNYQSPTGRKRWGWRKGLLYSALFLVATLAVLVILFNLFAPLIPAQS